MTSYRNGAAWRGAPQRPPKSGEKTWRNWRAIVRATASMDEKRGDRSIDSIKIADDQVSRGSSAKCMAFIPRTTRVAMRTVLVSLNRSARACAWNPRSTDLRGTFASGELWDNHGKCRFEMENVAAWRQRERERKRDRESREKKVITQ